MATLTITTLTPPAVTAALRDDDWATVDGKPAWEWLSRYWRDRIANAVPDDVQDAASRYGEEASECLRCLADALATESYTEAIYDIADYRQMGDLLPGDQTIIRWALECMLDWPQWTGYASIDDARAESWLRSLLS